MQNKDIQEFIGLANELEIDATFGPNHIFFSTPSVEFYEGSKSEWMWHSQRRVLDNHCEYGTDGHDTWQASIELMETIAEALKKAIKSRSTKTYAIALDENNELVGKVIYSSIKEFWDDDAEKFDDPNFRAVFVTHVTKRQYEMKHSDLLKSLVSRRLIGFDQ
jgi:hypothetical protein